MGQKGQTKNWTNIGQEIAQNIRQKFVLKIR